MCFQHTHAQTRVHTHNLDPHLYEAVDAAGHEHGAVRREPRNLWVHLAAKLDGAIEHRGVLLHFVSLPLRLAAEQVKGGARRQQPLVLLPA
jgi:hypothetical protein